MTNVTLGSDTAALSPDSGMNIAGLFVVASTIEIDEIGCATLEQAFRHRLGAVDETSGFRGLQLWREPRQPGTYLMVSWWSSREDWAVYMRSSVHDASHARIPTAPARPRGAGIRTFEIVAT